MLKTRTILISTIVAFSALIFGFGANAQTAPSVSTGEAAFVAARNVYLNASINPNGSYTQVWFQIDTNQSPTSVRGYQSAGGGTTAVNLQAGIINLRLDTTYYYRAVARNSNGTTLGEVRSFRTQSDSSYSGTGSTNTNNNYTPSSSGSGSSSGAPMAPSVATNGPASVGSTTATINGSVNPNNVHTVYWFDFGTSPSLGQKTSVQTAGVGNTWQLVTGNLSGLTPNLTYYYRVTAQNNQGTAFGELKSFTTTISGGSASGTNGQVLGVATASGNGSGTTGTGSGTSGSSTKTSTTAGSKTPSNPRPSFISLEYSLASDGSLVVVSSEMEPKPGDEFSYTVVYKNDTGYHFNAANLKVLIPSEAEYVSASIEPSRLSGGTVEFKLGDIAPDTQGTVTVTVKIKDTVAPGTNVIFTSVLGYKDVKGVQLATTSYLTVKVSQGVALGSSSLFGLLSGAATFWLIVIALVVLMGLLVYKFIKMKKDAELEETNIFGPKAIPPTFEPPVASPLGRPDIFQPVQK